MTHTRRVKSVTKPNVWSALIEQSNAPEGPGPTTTDPSTVFVPASKTVTRFVSSATMPNLDPGRREHRAEADREADRRQRLVEHAAPQGIKEVLPSYADRRKCVKLFLASAIRHRGDSFNNARSE